MSTTIEMLRAQCRIDIDDATEDELLTLYFTAARRRAENFIYPGFSIQELKCNLL